MATVEMFCLAYSQLEQKLEQLFGLKEAVVVENSPLNTKYDHATSLGTKTIKLLETYLHDGDIVGVSMGQTLYTVCHSSCVDTEAIACTFVPVIGGYTTHGSICTAEEANEKGYVPFGLVTNKAVMKQDVKKGTPITYDMIDLDKTTLIYKLRKEQDAMYGRYVL